MIYELVKHDHPLLSTVLEHFDFDNPPIDPVELATNLTETMLKNNGLGLSASQCGLPYRAFVIANNPVMACFNPRIIDASYETELSLEEGCLTYPYLYLKVKRPRLIKVRYTLPNGETVTERFDGLTARVFLHEMDHMEGINFTTKVHSYHLYKALKKKQQFLRAKKNNMLSEKKLSYV
jgi:peptide deformylase